MDSLYGPVIYCNLKITWYISSWKLVKPNSLRLFHFNPIISVVEAADGDEFSCFAT